MFTVQEIIPREERMRAAKAEESLQTLMEPEQPFDAQAHQIIDAVSAMVMNAQCGLRWLRLEPHSSEEVRQSLSRIAADGKRACELVIRLRSIVNQLPNNSLEASDY
jgi:hypothetical protein